MPAYFNQGFSVREPMWHGLGTILDGYPGREEAMAAAGHDFRIVEKELLVAQNAFDFPKLQGWKALVKEDNNKVLNVVRSSYEVIQNDTMWDIVDAIVDQPNVKYETAGVLKDGAVLWVLAWLDEPATVNGDNSAIYPYVCVSTTHDGSGACSARAVNIRVVCWNTFSAAEGQAKRSGREFTFRHTRNVMARIEDAKRALTGVRESHSQFMELANELAKLPVSHVGIEHFVTEFIPMPVAKVVSDRVVGNIEEARARIRKILAGPTINQERGYYNAYDLLQAGGEYLDHLRGYRSSDTYFGRTLLRHEPLKAKLLPLVKEAASI